jgi:hypothetical protein
MRLDLENLKSPNPAKEKIKLLLRYGANPQKRPNWNRYTSLESLAFLMGMAGKRMPRELQTQILSLFKGGRYSRKRGLQLIGLLESYSIL